MGDVVIVSFAPLNALRSAELVPKRIVATCVRSRGHIVSKCRGLAAP